MVNRKTDVRRRKTLTARIFSIILVLLILSCLYSCYFIFKKYSATSIESEQKSPVSTSIKEIVSEEKKSVCIDPGHGGNDIGASYGSLSEANINLEASLKLKSILEDNGYEVYITRTEDTYMAKRARANYCNSVKADIMVSVHHNAYDSDSSVDYSTALYYKDSDQKLASSILDSVSDNLNLENKGIAKFDNSLLWVADMPAALSESFFITSKKETSLLSQSNSNRLQVEAQGIADGIIKYFTDPDSINVSIGSDSLVINRDDSED